MTDRAFANLQQSSVYPTKINAPPWGSRNRMQTIPRTLQQIHGDYLASQGIRRPGVVECEPPAGLAGPYFSLDDLREATKRPLMLGVGQVAIVTSEHLAKLEADHAQVAGLRAKVAELQGDLSARGADARALADVITKIQGERDKAREAALTLGDRLAQCEDQYRAQADRLVAAQAGCHGPAVKDVDRLRRQVNALNSELAATRHQRDVHVRQVDDLEAKRQGAACTIGGLQVERDTFRRERDAADLKVMQLENRAANLSAAEQKIVDLKLGREELIGQRDYLHQRLDKERETNAGLVADRDRLGNELSKMWFDSIGLTLATEATESKAAALQDALGKSGTLVGVLLGILLCGSDPAINYLTSRERCTVRDACRAASIDLALYGVRP